MKKASKLHPLRRVWRPTIARWATWSSPQCRSRLDGGAEALPGCISSDGRDNLAVASRTTSGCRSRRTAQPDRRALRLRPASARGALARRIARVAGCAARRSDGDILIEAKGRVSIAPAPSGPPIGGSGPFLAYGIKSLAACSKRRYRACAITPAHFDLASGAGRSLYPGIRVSGQGLG
jgi:hypothetical protein